MNKLFKLVVLFIFFTNGVPQQFNAQCALSPVPYYEDFQSITNNNQLPLCWASSSLGSTCLTYTNGTKYAAFFHSPAATSYFYSKQLQLVPGYTYSASVWYNTGNSGALNWTDLSLLNGISQNPTGLVPIVSTSGPASSSVYTALSGTFTVSSFGMNYIAVRATGSPTGAAQYLNWDDLQVTLPCSLNPVNLNVISTGTTLCVGQQSVLITAYGAGQYLWNNGSTSSAIVVSPNVPTIYSVTGTDAITGCTASASIMITVYPSPVVSVLASSSNTVCPGQSITLSAFGASSFSWSTGSTGSSIVVTPTLSQVFNVTGTNSFSCSNMASQNVVVSACVGIKNQSLLEEGVNIYPNPFENNLTIISQTAGQYSLINTLGQVLVVAPFKEGSVELNTEGLPKGLYYLRLESEKRSAYHKAVKE